MLKVNLKGAALALVSAVLVCAAAHAADPFPSRAIKLLVPFPPGGGADAVVRPYSTILQADLGQAVFLDNVPGASGNVGTALAVRSPPDGYTIVLGANTLATNPHLSKLNFDPLKDLVPIARVAYSPLVIVVHPSVKATSLKELIAVSKNPATPINFGTPGTATPMHLAGELLNRSTGSMFTHIPYKGSGPALNDLLGGQIQMMITSLSTVLPYLKTGKIRGIAILSDKRSVQAPDLPTSKESGVPDVETLVWYGFFVPSATPAAVVRQLEEAVRKGSQNPELIGQYRAAGIEPEFMPAAEVKRSLRAEYDRWGKVIRDAKIVAE